MEAYLAATIARDHPDWTEIAVVGVAAHGEGDGSARSGGEADCYGR